jgi:1-acyl-sn-glycerol-3-phosphate acyltransferase
MKIGYGILRFWIKYSLYLYYGKIELQGKENIPADRPILFLPNHQNALIDVLLIAVSCDRKPYFLTRSDVFTNPWLNRFFSYLQMMPVYRIRDGRDTILRNEEIFARCARLLAHREAIVIFPEANHNLKRRVRPLSNGFIRILFKAQNISPDLDLYMLPVGFNYKRASQFPDRVAIHYGDALPLRKFFDGDDITATAQRVKKAVKGQLVALTTHIENLSEYEHLSAQLDARGVNYLNPKEVNATVARLGAGKADSIQHKKRLKGIRTRFFFALFCLLNLPIVLGWKFWLKPKVWEPEFMATFRFGFALFAVPVYYLILGLCMALLSNPQTAMTIVVGLFLFNWAYVKWT